jgi:GNAT superfamily N-acetyltransferase
LVSLRTINSEDIIKLVDISKRAFENDINYGAPKVGGPPGYDSQEWQSDIATEATAYYVILECDNIVGGLIVFGTGGDYWLGRMFVDPECQNRGIGSTAIKLMEAEFPDAYRWRLETPIWNFRNHLFYEKVGYKRVGVAHSGDYLYEKNIDRLTGR